MNLRVVIAAVVFVASIPPLLLAGALAYPSLQQAFYSARFEASAWRAARSEPASDWPTRLRMVDDLLARQELIGLSGDQLVALLGSPDDVNLFRETSQRQDDDTWDIGYRLGPERGPIVRIDYDWLLIDLDGTGRVRRVAVLND